MSVHALKQKNVGPKSVDVNGIDTLIELSKTYRRQRACTQSLARQLRSAKKEPGFYGTLNDRYDVAIEAESLTAEKLAIHTKSLLVNGTLEQCQALLRSV